MNLADWVFSMHQLHAVRLEEDQWRGWWWSGFLKIGVEVHVCLTDRLHAKRWGTVPAMEAGGCECGCHWVELVEDFLKSIGTLTTCDCVDFPTWKVEPFVNCISSLLSTLALTVPHLMYINSLQVPSLSLMSCGQVANSTWTHLYLPQSHRSMLKCSPWRCQPSFCPLKGCRC